MDEFHKIRDSLNQSRDPQHQSFIESEQSHDVLVSKHLIPPPLMLLPKQNKEKTKALMPMIPLPDFVGIIPNFQPLDKPCQAEQQQFHMGYNWIGNGFTNVVYRKYEEASYCKIDNQQQNWNIWACDVTKLLTPNKMAVQEVDSVGQLKPYYKLNDESDRTLVFESRFESGNLSLVSKVSDGEYNLLLQNDLNTNSYSQWFFFKVSNTLKSSVIKFNIMNLYKHNNLYNSGMKIIVYSKKESEENNISWHRAGEKIKYFENGYSRSYGDDRQFYTLSWQYQFAHGDDEVYFAYSYPWNYTHLNTMIHRLENGSFTRNICRRSTLCKSLAGNSVDVLTITEDHPFEDLEKGYIVIIARIHPGQTVSSYVCNGIMQFLLSDCQKARKLRQHFVFKIIPMMNPDGVIHGNYRCNVMGYDLNRKWENPSKLYHPEVYYCKKMIENLKEMGEVVLFCDLHGHSMKKNVFIYGSHDTTDPRKGKEFPFLISKLFRGFSFADCSFLKNEQKQGTTRTVLAKEVYQNNVFTLESSFCGPEYQNIHFTVRHFEELGQKFCEAILLTFKDHIKQMHIMAAMRNSSLNFPTSNEFSDNSQIEFEDLIDFSEIDYMNLRERVNSENSQGQQEEMQIDTLLDDRTVKKYLFMKNNRVQTTSGVTSRAGSFFRKSLSKDMTIKYEKKTEFNTFRSTLHKSNSPTKRKQFYQSAKVSKNIKQIKEENHQKIFEKVTVQPKLFEPEEFIAFGSQRRKNYRSTSKLGPAIQIEKNIREDKDKSSNIKLILNKNYEFKPLGVFKNSTLKNYVSCEGKMRIQRKSSDFIIRKSKGAAMVDDKLSSNLFKSVLTSLRSKK